MSYGGMLRRSFGVAVATVAFVAILVAAAAAGPVALLLGKSFTLVAGPQENLGVGASVLGADGTVWLAEPISQPRSFEIVARAANGRRLGPVIVSAQAGFENAEPTISVSGATATFAWFASGDSTSTGDAVAVETRRCTPAGCQPTQTLTRWTSGNYSPGQPVLAESKGRTVVVFNQGDANGSEVMWAQSDGGAFGPVRPIAQAPAIGVVPNAWLFDDPVLVTEASGRILAAWPNFGGASFAVSWSSWSAKGGFTPPRTLPGGAGTYAGDLVAAPDGSGAALAWIQGNNVTDPGLIAEPVWVARQNAQGFAKPTRVFGGYAFSLSLAGGGDVTALAFNTAKAAGLDGDSDGPVLVARSVDDAPFRTMTLTANAAPYPTASVNSVGETLVTWNRQTLYPQTPTSTAEIAIAAPHGTFSSPETLGSELFDDSPNVHTVSSRSLVVWQAAPGIAQATLVTP